MITLIGEDLAKKNLTFLFNGPVKECETCRFKSSCVESLKEGRLYKILNVKENEQPCPVHDRGKVKVVEVEEAEITAFIDAKKSFKGSTLVYNKPDCTVNCVYHEFCFPEGLKEDYKCTITDVVEKHIDGCVKGYLLNKVVLKIN
jgi:uncharacterized protein (UPF0179 family)